MADFGIVEIPTHYTIPAVEMARWAEGNGFESLWFGEHSHIPTSRKSPFPMGGELPVYYKEFFDPFIGLTAGGRRHDKAQSGDVGMPGARAQYDQSRQDGRLSRSSPERPVSLWYRGRLERRRDGR